MRPDSRFQQPNMSFDDGIDLNDTFYQALPDDKKEEYQNAKLENIAKDIDETAEKAAKDIEKTDFYQKQLDATTQAATKEKSKYLTIQQKLEGMKAGSIKGIATRDINGLNEPRYPQNKMYREFYKKLIQQHDLIITNYLDLTAISELNESKKEWWQIRAWNQWPTFKKLNLLNQKSPYKNLYYYEKEWIKEELVDKEGTYKYNDTDFFYETIDAKKEIKSLSMKREKHKKIFFFTLGSMSNHGLKIGKNSKFKIIKEIKKLFQQGWAGITTKNEYNNYLKNIKEENFIHLIGEWYPHDIIFKNIDLFLTHGGAGSFARAVKHKTKTYVFPFQLDQFYFGKTIKDLHKGKLII
jgi:hypothetical protein